MKNGFIGSEQTTITCAHIIDPVSGIFLGRKTLKKKATFFHQIVCLAHGWGLGNSIIVESLSFLKSRSIKKH